MIKKYLYSRFLTLYIIPFVLGSLSVLSFEPFNLTIINYGEENIVLNSVYSTSNLSTGELTFIAKKAYKFISYDSVWYPLG